MDNFTPLAQKTIQQASQIAIKYDAPELLPFHVLEALLTQTQSPIKGLLSPILTSHSHNYQELVQATKDQNNKGARVTGNNEFRLSQQMQVLLIKAEAIKDQEQASHVNCEHLLMALITYDSTINDFLKRYNINKETITAQIQAKKDQPQSASNTLTDIIEALGEFASDLTAQAQAGTMDPIIGRDEEIRRTMQILSRRTKNNPVLVGDP